MLAVGLVLQEIRNRSVRMMVDAKILLMLCYVSIVCAGCGGIVGYCNSPYLRGTLQQGVGFIKKRLSMVCFVIVDGLGFQS